MSTFLLYLIMQADSIKSSMCAVVAVTAFIGLIALVMWSFTLIEGHPREPLARRILIILVSTFLGGLFLNALIPSTKSLAVIVVLPAIVNNEAVQGEAKEIYTLAKEALKEMAK